MKASPAPTANPIVAVFSKALGDLQHDVWIAVSSSPLLMTLVLLAASAFSISVYRAIRWTVLGFAGKDPIRRFSAADRAALLARAGHKCEHHILGLWRCGMTTKLQADHVHPHSKGGRTHIDNGQVLCARHNKAKSSPNPV